MPKPKIIFKKGYLLKGIENVIEEAEKGISDPYRTIDTSDIPKVLRDTSRIRPNSLDNALNIFIAFIALILSAQISAGICAAVFHFLEAEYTEKLKEMSVVIPIGIFILIILIINVFGRIIANNSLTRRKERLLPEAVKAQKSIIQQIKMETQADEERREYLSALNKVLKEIIRDLKSDIVAVR